jgi:hypothetical protein
VIDNNILWKTSNKETYWETKRRWEYRVDFGEILCVCVCVCVCEVLVLIQFSCDAHDLSGTVTGFFSTSLVTVSFSRRLCIMCIVTYPINTSTETSSFPHYFCYATIVLSFSVSALTSWLLKLRSYLRVARSSRCLQVTCRPTRTCHQVSFISLLFVCIRMPRSSSTSRSAHLVVPYIISATQGDVLSTVRFKFTLIYANRKVKEYDERLDYFMADTRRCFIHGDF